MVLKGVLKGGLKVYAADACWFLGNPTLFVDLANGSKASCHEKFKNWFLF